MLRPLENRFLFDMRKEAASHLPLEGAIIEIGAGSGLNFGHYTRECSVTATDLSRKMLQIAKTRQEENIRLAQADAQILPFADNTFDAAFGTLVFCSITDPFRAFSELRRIVKTNGRIVLLEHVRPPGLLGYVFDLLNMITVPMIEDHFNRPTAQMAADSGLIIDTLAAKFGGTINLMVCTNKK